jgi:integrase
MKENLPTITLEPTLKPMLATTNQHTHLAPLHNEPTCEFANDQDIIADWLLSKAVATRKTYFTAVKQLSQYLGPIHQWSKRGIQVWVESMKGTIKIATINKKLAAVRSLLSHCVAEGYLDYSVATNIGKVKEDKENKASQSQSHTERVIGSDEVWELIAAASTERDRLALKTCYLLGLRVHELSNLHWSDFSRDGNRYKVRIIGKNSKEAYLPVDRELVTSFASWKPPATFSNRDLGESDRRCNSIELRNAPLVM